MSRATSFYCRPRAARRGEGEAIEHRTRDWSAAGRRDQYRDEIVADLDRVADRARAGDWGALFEALQAPAGIGGPERVNTPRVGSVSGFAPLHQAAWHGADVDGPLRLPQAAPLGEMDTGSSLWCAVPGMYGRFVLRRDGAALVSESWCRVVGGSGQEHRITAQEVRLVASGFV